MSVENNHLQLACQALGWLFGKEVLGKRDFLNELHTKSMLIDMKGELIHTICGLLEGQACPKKGAAYAFLEVVALIELEERKVNPAEAKSILKVDEDSVGSGDG